MLNETKLESAPVSATKTLPWRSVGVWLAIILVVYMFYNSGRSLLSPTDFAVSYGLPPAAASSAALVYVYAIRALFLGAFGAALLLTRKFKTLSLYALVAVIMPVGDAILVSSQGAELGTVIRHILTGGFLLITWFLLERDVRRGQLQAG